ncbi:hypothetical protein [Desulfomonile tiedjei]|uniref:Uncharacterized protein n=1 Tax=Desulfomonile tiedjei (strain ATCC 49306 / DSM 6799 / DCB-1) TaxID=706587 RepID=I4C3A6_DESTA|nr:hypothetical protein [Desulfomonile tiedjei]AFM24047.1 hypothetical protein Desti_1334 [Desulfomonile tiedjei DSM 6799]
MTLNEALDRIRSEFESAKAEGIKPSIRVSGEEWVCTLDRSRSKFVVVAKEKHLMLVHMVSKQKTPDVTRINVPDHSQQNLIDDVQKIVNTMYEE